MYACIVKANEEPCMYFCLLYACIVFSNLFVNDVTHFVFILMHILKCLFVCFKVMVETKILRQHRKVICNAMILYLYLLPEDYVRRVFNPLHNAFDGFIT